MLSEIATTHRKVTLGFAVSMLGLILSFIPGMTDLGAFLLPVGLGYLMGLAA